jgi:L-rhamnose mutarotase
MQYPKLFHLFKRDRWKAFRFSYLNTPELILEGDMKKMAADSTTQRWWKETDPCQQPYLKKREEKYGLNERSFHTD